MLLFINENLHNKENVNSILVAVVKKRHNANHLFSKVTNCQCFYRKRRFPFGIMLDDEGDYSNRSFKLKNIHTGKRRRTSSRGLMGSTDSLDNLDDINRRMPFPCTFHIDLPPSFHFFLSFLFPPSLLYLVQFLPSPTLTFSLSLLLPSPTSHHFSVLLRVSPSSHTSFLPHKRLPPLFTLLHLLLSWFFRCYSTIRKYLLSSFTPFLPHKCLSPSFPFTPPYTFLCPIFPHFPPHRRLPSSFPFTLLHYLLSCFTPFLPHTPPSIHTSSFIIHIYPITSFLLYTQCLPPLPPPSLTFFLPYTHLHSSFRFVPSLLPSVHTMPPSLPHVFPSIHKLPSFFDSFFPLLFLFLYFTFPFIVCFILFEPRLFISQLIKSILC